MLMHQLLALMPKGSVLRPQDVFATTLYTGNASARSIVTGIDADRDWIKLRSTGGGNMLFDKVRGANAYLQSNQTNAQETSFTDTLTAFNSNGFSLGADASTLNVNQSGQTLVAWSYKNAPKFSASGVVTKSSGSNATIDLSSLGVVGMVRVKRTDATGSWYVWHRSLTAGKLLIGETNAAEATLGHITVTGTTVDLVNGVIANGTYYYEAFAHDTSTDGLVQCGLITHGSSGTQDITTGWGVQFVLIKTISQGDSWHMLDTTRGMTSVTNLELRCDTNGAEGNLGSGYVYSLSNGFRFDAGLFGTAGTAAYMVIREPI